METHKIEPQEKILLLVLPMWERLIPPMGISSLKTFLQQHGYNVKAVDANISDRLRAHFDNYLSKLKNLVPPEKSGNYYNIVTEVINNHMMALLHRENEAEYLELIKIIIYKTFYHRPDDKSLRELNEIITGYFKDLENYILDLLEEEKPALMGISVYSSTFPSSLYAFQTAKKKYPHLKTVMGGGIFSNQLSLGSLNLEYFMERSNAYVDRLILGEGELLFLKYLRGELPEKRILTFKDIDNQLLDLSQVKTPDFSGYELDKYGYLATYGARSCPLNCSFCSETVIWGKYRKKNARQVADELIELYDRHSQLLFLMCDSLLNPLVNELSKEMAQKDAPIYWDGYLRVSNEVCDHEKTQLWRQGGFYRARLGLESGSPRILELMDKRISVQQIIDAVSSLAFAGIKTTTYWIIGYPGETEEDFLKTLELLEKLKDDIYEADCNPFKYFLSGQVLSEEWQSGGESKLLYPAEAKDKLITQTWELETEPSREETFRRLNRFVQHCKKLGIPNPYSMYEIHNADLRWKKLHKNAVPTILELKEKNVENGKKKVKLNVVEGPPQDDGDFDF
ncbi:MAG: radical SAM protein [bacterium]|nr:radical SAM protein [bacterium]